MPIWTDPQALSADNFNMHVAAGAFGLDAADVVLMGGLINDSAGTFTDYLGGLAEGSFSRDAVGKYTLPFDLVGGLDAFLDEPVIVCQPIGIPYYGVPALQSVSTAQAVIWSMRCDTDGGGLAYLDRYILVLIAGKYRTPYWVNSDSTDLLAANLNKMVAGGSYDTKYSRLCGGYAVVVGAIINISASFGMQTNARQNADGSYRLRFRGRFSAIPTVIATSFGATTANFYQVIIVTVATDYVDIELRNQTNAQITSGAFSFLAIGG